MTERVINTLGSMFHRKAKPMTDEVQPELPFEDRIPEPDAHDDETVTDPVGESDTPSEPEVVGLFIAGQGSDTPELHVRLSGRIIVRPLTNPVTVSQLADILSSLK